MTVCCGESKPAPFHGWWFLFSCKAMWGKRKSGEGFLLSFFLVWVRLVLRSPPLTLASLGRSPSDPPVYVFLILFGSPPARCNSHRTKSKIAAGFFCCFLFFPSLSLATLFFFLTPLFSIASMCVCLFVCSLACRPASYAHLLVVYADSFLKLCFHLRFFLLSGLF